MKHDNGSNLVNYICFRPMSFMFSVHWLVKGFLEKNKRIHCKYNVYLVFWQCREWMCSACLIHTKRYMDQTRGCHNSQPWGIVYWLVFKRLPVQTTYLFLQAFLKYFYSQEMLTTSEIKFKLHLILTLSVQLQTIMTFYEENYGQNEFNL